MDSSTTVVLKQDAEEADCDMCYDGVPICHTEKTLTNVQNYMLKFSCPKPQNVYSVEIKKHIGKSLSNLVTDMFFQLLYYLENEITIFFLLRMHQDYLHPNCRRSPS